MDRPVEHFWELRLAALRDQLEKNNFDAHVVGSADAARTLVLEDILPRIGAESVSWGGSGTFKATGLYEILRDDPALITLDTWDRSLSAEAKLERQREALLTDCFFLGANAITEQGWLVNLDRIGNRVGGLVFGPRHVVVLAGRNKVVPDLERAMARIKEFVAPANAMRLDKKTPCVKTGECLDCSSPDRICNVWTITEKSYPKGRISVVLINQDLGF